MHADGDWQAVEGALSKDMATLSGYLQTKEAQHHENGIGSLPSHQGS